jgi:hypothetical protein
MCMTDSVSLSFNFIVLNIFMLVFYYNQRMHYYVLHITYYTLLAMLPHMRQHSQYPRKTTMVAE